MPGTLAGVRRIAAEVGRLRGAGLGFRGPIVKRPGGGRTCLTLPGHPTELFQPAG